MNLIGAVAFTWHSEPEIFLEGASAAGILLRLLRPEV